jgi:hypothetical protein
MQGPSQPNPSGRHRTSAQSQWEWFGSSHVQRWWLKTLLARGAKAARGLLRVQGDRLELECMPHIPCFRPSSTSLPNLAFSRAVGPVPLQAPPGIRTTLITAWNKPLTEVPRIDNAIDCTFLVSGTHDTQDLQKTPFGCVEATSAITSQQRNKRLRLSSGGGNIADTHVCN